MSRTRSSSSPSVLSGGSVYPFTPFQLVVGASHNKSRSPPRSTPGSPSRNRSRRLSKSTRASSSSTSLTSDSSSSVYSFSRSEPPTLIPVTPAKKSSSLPVFVKYRMPSRSSFESDEEDDETDGLIYTRKSSNASLRTRLMASRINDSGPKGITTTPGLSCAGETETESEEPRNLPTSRIITSSGPLVPQNALGPMLFEFTRWLSIVPALIGAIYNTYCFHSPPSNARIHRADYFIATLWAILTGYQCLSLTTGLLRRWRLYYTPLPTLIRLFALQAICWPATQITLTVLNFHQRPAVCWAVIATTTFCSRSVQMWVTSNIIDNEKSEYVSLRKWGGRKWDWARVGQNAMPAFVVYFLWTWILIIRQEFQGGC